MSYYRKGEQHLIENYELAKADNFVGWVLHHRLEFTLNGEPALSVKDLIRFGMYYHRPYFELIYMKSKEHFQLHSYGNKKWLNHHHKEETRKKISESLKGHVGALKGKRLSEEHKKRIRETLKSRYSK